MNNEIKEILEDDDELIVRFKDNSFECFDTLPKYVLDYITNLQQENERLEEELKYTIQDVQHNQIVTKLAKEKNDYKTRCEKASEITENLLKTEKSGYYQIIFKQQLNILQNGSDK